MEDKHLHRGATLCALIMAILSGAILLLASAVSARAAGYAAGNAGPNVKAGHDLPMELEFGGYKRTFHVHVPSSYEAGASKPLPLLIMLHGAGGDGLQAARQTGWDHTADKENFFAVFPDALPTNPKREPSFKLNPRFWDDASKRGEAVRGTIDDVGFLGAMIDDVEKKYPIDAKRVYLTGFSSGASMTFHAVASPLSNRIAAAAPVSGHLFGADDAKLDRVTPVLLIYGTKDPLNPMEGGPVTLPWGGTSQRPKVADTVATWAKLTGCPGTPVLISEDGGVKRLAYGPGKEGAEFLFWTIDGMGHHWPGSKDETLPASLVGAPSDKLDATEAIWKFLSRHSLSGRAEAP